MHEIKIAESADDQAGAKYVQLIVAAAADHPEPSATAVGAVRGERNKGRGKGLKVTVLIPHPVAPPPLT
jgi:hypothetical protein